jgi:hypothetical protein
MIAVLADHNLEGQATLLWGVLAREGWLDLIDLRLVSFGDVGLALTSNDRVVWRFAQVQGLLLLTANRQMKGVDSLEQTIREEGTATSLPVVTVASVKRIDEHNYRLRCAYRLVEIALDLDRYRGAGRLFIP